jgi:hypothetical protein
VAGGEKEAIVMIFKRVRTAGADFESYRLIQEAYGWEPDLLFEECPTCGEPFYADKGTSRLVRRTVIVGDTIGSAAVDERLPDEHFRRQADELRAALKRECPEHGDIIGV